jgi:hypothetical protein
MIERTFIDKQNTIFRDSDDNFGLNPILMLCTGETESRALIRFDIERLRKMHEDGDLGNEANVAEHTLKMYNCGSLDEEKYGRSFISTNISGTIVRNTSFTVVALRMLQSWDEGVGFDSSSDVWLQGGTCVSDRGSNWYHAKTGLDWRKYTYNSENGRYEFSLDEDNVPYTTEGVYSDDFIIGQYDKYMNNDDSSLVVGIQKFDHGNEDLSMDISRYINGCINGEFDNNGILLALLPMDYEVEKGYTMYTGFFGKRTNTFYLPFLETYVDNHIDDKRDDFKCGQDNKLFLYTKFGCQTVNLDSNPVCEIEGSEYQSEKLRKGVYFVTVNIPSEDEDGESNANRWITDKWKGLSINDIKHKDVESEFLTKEPDDDFSISSNENFEEEPYFIISGIRENEKVSHNEFERKVTVTAKIPYTGLKKRLSGNLLYRLYVNDGAKNIYVTRWDNADMANDCSFVIKPNQLVPQEYHLDIEYDDKIKENALTFTIRGSLDKS